MDYERGAGPLYSVIIRTYQRGELLGRAIRSVLTQTFPNFEVVVADDCSPASPEQFVRSFDDPRIRFFRNPENGGASATANLGLRNSGGDFVCFLDDDDELFPTFLEEMNRHFETVGPEMSFAWCGVKEYLEGADEPRYLLVEGSALDLDDSERPAKVLALGMSFGFTMRRSCWQAIGYFDETLRYAVDFEYFVRLVQTDARGAGLNRYLICMHRQPDRLTKLTPERSRTVENILMKHRDYLESVGLYDTYRRQFVRHLDQRPSDESALQRHHPHVPTKGTLF